MKISLFAFTVFLILQNSFAAIPTVEGLLRNGSNVDIENEFVVIRVKLEKQQSSPLLLSDTTPSEQSLDSSSQEVTLDNKEANTENAESIVLENGKAPIYLKLIFSKADNRPVSLLQVVYNNSQMTKDGIVKVTFFPNIYRTVSKDQNVERVMLYSLFSIFALNDSRPMSELLKATNQDYKSNIEMLDPDKKLLLARYKEYLEAVKKDDSLKETLESPLKVTDEDEKERVKEVMKRRMYMLNDQVKLVREEGKFYWQVALENLDARFSNVKNQLLKMELRTPNGNIKTLVSDYVLFDGTHEIPKNIIIRDIIDSIYHLQTLAYSTFDSDKKSLKDRYRDYEELLQKSASKNEIIPKDYFIY